MSLSFGFRSGLIHRSRRPRQVIDSSDDEELDEEGEYSGGEDINAEFVSPLRPSKEEASTDGRTLIQRITRRSTR